jgi:hypothetical protein
VQIIVVQSGFYVTAIAIRATVMGMHTRMHANTKPNLPTWLLMSIPVLRMNTGTTCMHVRKQLQQGRCDRTKACG